MKVDDGSTQVVSNNNVAQSGDKAGGAPMNTESSVRAVAGAVSGGQLGMGRRESGDTDSTGATEMPRGRIDLPVGTVCQYQNGQLTLHMQVVDLADVCGGESRKGFIALSERGFLAAGKTSPVVKLCVGLPVGCVFDFIRYDPDRIGNGHNLDVVDHILNMGIAWRVRIRKGILVDGHGATPNAHRFAALHQRYAADLAFSDHQFTARLSDRVVPVRDSAPLPATPHGTGIVADTQVSGQPAADIAQLQFYPADETAVLPRSSLLDEILALLVTFEAGKASMRECRESICDAFDAWVGSTVRKAA